MNGHLFLEIWEMFLFYFVEYVINTLGLYLFSFFNSDDSNICSFNEVKSFCIFLSQLFNLMSKNLLGF
jgi:hypothetical protein